MKLTTIFSVKTLSKFHTLMIYGSLLTLTACAGGGTPLGQFTVEESGFSKNSKITQDSIEKLNKSTRALDSNSLSGLWISTVEYEQFNGWVSVKSRKETPLNSYVMDELKKSNNSIDKRNILRNSPYAITSTQTIQLLDREDSVYAANCKNAKDGILMGNKVNGSLKLLNADEANLNALGGRFHHFSYYQNAQEKFGLAQSPRGNITDNQKIVFVPFEMENATIVNSVKNLLENDNLKKELPEAYAELEKLGADDSILVKWVERVTVKMNWIKASNDSQVNLGFAKHDGLSKEVNCFFTEAKQYFQDSKLSKGNFLSNRYWVGNTTNTVDLSIMHNSQEQDIGLFEMLNIWDASELTLSGREGSQISRNNYLKASDINQSSAQFDLCTHANATYVDTIECLRPAFNQYQQNILGRKMNNSTTSDMLYSSITQPNAAISNYTLNPKQHTIIAQTDGIDREIQLVLPSTEGSAR